MTLEEFYRREQDRLENFCKYWREFHAEYPDDFPLEITPGEWDEEYYQYSC